jgi:hypothetical protein
MGCGQVTVPRVRRQPNPRHHCVGAAARRTPLLAASTSRTVRPVRRWPRPQRPRHLPPRHCSPPAGDARARWTPRSMAAPMPPAPLGAGWTGALSGPTGIPAVAPGASCPAVPGRALVWRRPARRSRASASRPTCWWGPWAPWRKAWASAAVARVFAVDSNTVLAWLLEVADHLQACAPYCLRDVRVTQGQLAALSAWRSAVKAGEISAAAALPRQCRAPHWGWVARAPVPKLLRTSAGGDRTLALAQGLVHQGVQVLAPGGVPVCLTDGLKEYRTALLTHCGPWVHPPRRQTTGPPPSRAGCRCPTSSRHR